MEHREPREMFSSHVRCEEIKERHRDHSPFVFITYSLLPDHFARLDEVLGRSDKYDGHK